jgi:hypothetical protein
MQKATFTTSIPHIISRLFLQRPNHTSITLRFKIRETFQINQSNFGISNNTFFQGLYRIITFMLVGRQERYFIYRILLIKANPE